MTRVLALAALVACSSPAPVPHPRRFITQGQGLVSATDRSRLQRTPVSFGTRTEDATLGSTPVWTRKTVYVQCDTEWELDETTLSINGDLTKHGCDPGDSCYDGRDGTDINRPFRTIPGAENYYAVGQPPDGTWLDIALLADNRDADWDAPNKQISRGRVCFTDAIFVGASYSFIHSVTIRGPRGGWKRTSDLALVSHADETAIDPNTGATIKTGCLKLQFSPPATFNTYHLQWLRDDGREVTFPLPGSGNESGYSYVCGGINDAGFTAALNAGGGNHFYDWQGAVMIWSSLGDTQFRGVHFYGDGGGRIGDRSSANAPVLDANLMGVLSRVELSRSFWTVTGSYVIGEAVRFSDNAYFRNGQPRLRGVAVEGHLVIASDGAMLTNSSENTLTEDPQGYMRAFTLPLSTTQGTGVDDPDYPTIGPDFSIGEETDSYLQLGDEVGSSTGRLRIIHGFGIRKPDSGFAIKLIGRGSELFQLKSNVVGVVLGATTETGLWSVDGAVAAIDDAQKDTAGAFAVGFNVTGSDCAYKVGNGGCLIWGTGPSRWAQSHAYTVGQRVVTDPSLGANGFIYQCITSGTSSGSGTGPTGSGTDITDGTAHWKYIADGAFRDPHGWNGYFSRRLEKSANGFPTGDDAIIRDRSWETATSYSTGR